MTLSLLRSGKFFNLSKVFFNKDYLRVSQNLQLVRFSSNETNKVKNAVDHDLLNQKLEALKKWQTMTRKEKFKILIKDYGKTIIIFHVTISLISLGIFYTLVSSGIDMTSVINLFTSNSEKFNATMVNSSTFILAYGIHKLFAPVRLSITIALAPIMVRYFRKVGIIKPALLKSMETKK